MINVWAWPCKTETERCEERLWSNCPSLYREDKPHILPNLVEVPLVPPPIIWLSSVMTVGKGSGQEDRDAEHVLTWSWLVLAVVTKTSLAFQPRL